MTGGAQNAHLTGADPTLIGINARRLILHACLVVIFGVGLVIAGVFSTFATGSVAFPIWAVIVLGAILCGWAVLNFGIAWVRPSALRIDAFGLSGYYVPTLKWSEVSRVLVDSQSLQLSIGLLDAHAVRMRQTNAWRRFRLIGGVAVVHSRGLDGDLDQIASIMNAHLSRIELDKSPPL
ncbi:hypothetical protein N9769_04195 [Ascidiaceihabitans sp.]|nr:hypothetical protein [Ascidiaceihabitans sp.]